MKKCMVFVVAALALTMMLATTVLASTVGQITATVNGVPTTATSGVDTEGLAARIAYAENLLNDLTPHTEEIANRHLVPEGEWAAPLGARTLFQSAINAANEAIDRVTFAPNATFEVTFGITNNPGFAGMAMMFGFPNDLIVEGFTSHLVGLHGANFMPPVDDDGNIVVARTTGEYRYHHAVWHRLSNLTVDQDLFTLTVRVAPTAQPGTVLQPITLALGNAIAPHYESPTNDLGAVATINLPNGVVGGGAGVTSNVAQIRVAQ